VAINADLYPWLSAAAIAWGVLDCFFGYAIFRFTVTLWGVAAGLLFGWSAGQALGLGLPGEIGGLVVGALLGGGLAFMLYLAAVFAAGFLFGATVGMLILANFNHMVALLTSGVLGVIGGVLAVKLQRVVLILATAVLGSFRSLLALMYFTDHLDWLFYLVQQPQQLPALIESKTWLFPSVLALATVGAVAQLGQARASGGKSRDQSKD